MCGIYGAFDLHERRVFEGERLAAMGRAIAHRGPDGAGVFVEPGVALGSQRLALVDPEHGAQPIVHERCVVVVNGELFEHGAERARLSARGARFRSQCDSEVWVHAFADEGERYLAKARGQFAVAIYDRSEHQLVLARDRFGICPLYVTEADGWLVFASEIKALFASGLVRVSLDPKAIDHVFSCLCASPIRSAFEGVAPVPPGHALTARPGARPSRRQFASIEFPAAGTVDTTGTSRERARAVADLEAALAGAVARRLAADAPVATYLSGGIDSSLLVALAARRGDVTAFSVRLDGVGPDEATLAGQTAAAVGAKHVVIDVGTREIADCFPALIAAAEVPILDHANAALYLLAREVRLRGFKAVLTGEGADEAFGGYPWTSLLHRGGPLLEYGGRAFGWLLGGVPRVGGDRDRKHPVMTTGAGQLYELTSRAGSFLYTDAFVARLGTWRPLDDHPWNAARIARWAPLHRSLYADYEFVLAGHLLADKGDRVAMAAGVEPRFPYLDEHVVDLAAGLPPTVKLRGSRDKWILREVAARYLPPHTANRSKLMFRAEPVIHSPARPPWVDELLSRESLARVGLFDSSKVAAARAAREGRHPRASLLQGGLTAVVSTQLLAHLFCGGGLCSLPAWHAPRAT